ncbi:MAG: tetratricopeptide repeat protein [Prevotellaceae bacterium]|jgi:TolA-binding protein|nr:tetratricopeptide repeat protein [Prevotellaceae bacterium]
MRRIVLLAFLSLSLTNICAQKTKTYTHSDKLFYDGKEMYDLKRFSVAFRHLDEYLQTQNRDRSPLYPEAEYYQASSAYEMRMKDAGRRLEQFVSNNPYSVHVNRARFLQGTLAFDKKNFKDALELFDKSDPENLSKEERFDYYFRTGYSYLQTNDLPNAKEAFTTLLSQKSRYGNSALYYSAYIDYLEKKYDAALPVFLSLQSNPDYERIVPYYILQIYYSQGKYDEVITSGEELLNKYPDNENNVEVYRLSGESFFYRKDYENTIKYLALYEKKATPVLRNSMYMLGIAYYQTQQYKNAIPNLQKVTVTEDLMAQNAYLHLGSAYLKENDKTNARMAFESAARMDFDKEIREEALYNYALIVYEQSYSPFNESVVAFERFLQEFPTSKYSDNIYDYLVNVYLTTKNYEAAYESIQKIKSKNPKILEARQRVLYSIGIQYFTEGNYSKAIESFTQSLEDGSSNRETEALALFWRAEAHARLKDETKAAADLQRFLNSVGARNSGMFNMAHYDLGYIYFSQKKYSEALNWFRKFVNLEEANKTLIADANNRIGDCYFYNRDLEKAQKSYTTVYALQGSGADYALFQQAFIQGLQKDYKGKIATLQKLIKTFPMSEYLADAMYEIGRSYIMLGDNRPAIMIYDELVLKYPHSPLSRKARLQTAMLYDEMGNRDKSIAIYKEIVDYYPSSIEAKTALENLKTIYFEKDDLQTYADYVASLGGIATFGKSEQDSLSYLAAERLYLIEDYPKAIESFSRYLENFSGSSFSDNARFYLANSYYKIDKKEKAKEQYMLVAFKQGYVNMEEALVNLAKIQYDLNDCEGAVVTLQRLLEVTQQANNRDAARLGILRCNSTLGNYEATIAAADELIKGDKLDPAIQREALFTRAKAFEKTDNPTGAFADFLVLSENTLDQYGAEANFRVAEYLFHEKKLVEAEKTIFDFIEKNTSHQYWLAKSFILLADAYMLQGNDFEAKQYLLSLRENYKGKDEIATEIKARLDEIENREFDKVIND